MKYLLRLIVVTLFITALSGCISFSNMSKDSSYSDLGEDSVIILGIKPDFRVHIYKGEELDYGWEMNNVAVTLNTFPEGGYIVAKLSPRSDGINYGVGGVLPEGIGGQLYMPCGGKETMTFEAPAGKVVYVGSLEFVGSNGSKSFKVTNDFDDAKKYLEQEYPSFSKHLEYSEPAILKVANISCTRTIYIPVVS
ncbi:hypothetical protein Misp06_03375 [Microbulbifer sp. NBRC 101763]|uniref:hypothetical protein n=1 Tax=unclassified Microbulbifer TaxID=2619833 RepID=UPI0030ADC770